MLSIGMQNDLPAAAVDKLAGIESPRRSLTVEKLSGFPQRIFTGVCERVSAAGTFIAAFADLAGALSILQSLFSQS